MNPATTRETAWNGVPMPQRIGAILAVAFGVALSVVDSSIANVALPTIARELGISEASSIWVVNAYQLSVMVSLLTFSALGEIAGYRRIYLFGLVVFTLASVWCATASSFATLIAARVAQGLGSAAITSINTTLIRIIYPRKHLGRGMGLNATVVAVSSVAGPTLSAAILSIAEWPWLFAVNIPIGLVALMMSRRYLPENPVKSTRGRLRWTDAFMNALTFGAMMLSIEGFSHGLDTRLVALLVVLTIGVGWLYVRRQLRSADPLLPFDLLRKPIFTVSILTSICSFLAQMLALVALPFYLQQKCGYTDVETGLLMTAWPAVIMIVAPVAGLLVERIHAGLLGGVGLAVMMAGLLSLAAIPDNTGDMEIVWRMVLCGAGFALFQSPNNSILIASSPTARSGSASGMLATARLTGQSSGAALMALIFHVAPATSTPTAFKTAAAFAFVGAVLSLARLRMPLPEGLTRKRKKR